MKVYDLINKYYFHDSLIEDVIYHAQKEEVIFKIEFCNWMQPNYEKNEPEMLECIITFEGVSQYVLEPSILNFDCDIILDVDYFSEVNSKNNYIKFVLLGADDVIIFKLYGENIESFIKFSSFSG